MCFCHMTVAARGGLQVERFRSDQVRHLCSVRSKDQDGDQSPACWRREALLWKALRRYTEQDVLP